MISIKSKFLKYFVFSFILLLHARGFCQEKYPSVGLMFYATPFMADTNNNAVISFNFDANVGYTYDKYTFRFDTLVSFNNFTQFKTKTNNSSDINVLGLFMFKVRFVPQFAFSTGIGMGWLRQATQTDASNVYSYSLLDMQVGVGCDIYTKCKYIYFSGISDLNLRFSARLFGLKSDNYFRLNTVVYFSFLNIFTDVGLCYEYNPIYRIDYPYFNYRMGIKVSFDFKQSKTNPRKIIIYKSAEESASQKKEEPKEPPKEQPKEVQPAEKKEKDPQTILYERFLDMYRKSFAGRRKGDVIPVPNLAFPKMSIDILPGTALRLNALSEVIKEKNLEIAVSCYIEATGSPEEELSFATKRANTIKYYLVARGVPSNKIKISANAIVYPAGTPNTEKNIEIKIIK